MTVISGPAKAIRRLRCRTTYAWRYSPSPILAGVRTLADGELGVATRMARSTAGPNAPTIGYVGPSEGVASLVSYVEELIERPAGGEVARVAWSASRAGAQERLTVADSDILFHAAAGRVVRRRTDPVSVVLPFRLHQVLPITDDFDTMMSRLHKNDRWRFRRNQRANDWSWECATRQEDLLFFLERMHWPTMQAQFAKRAVFEDALTATECLFRPGQLFFLRSAGQRVAGALCRWDERRRILRYRLNGVLDGSPELRQDGSFTAIYYYLMRWASEHRVAVVDLSGSVPFLARGIFQSKRKLHARVVIAATPARGLRVSMRVRRDTPAVRRFLADNPLITCLGTERPGDALEAVYFHDDERPARTDVPWHSPGIQAAREVHLDEFLAPLNGTSADRKETGWLR